MAENERFLPKKYYLKLLASRLKGYEIAQLNRIDLIVGISERDNQHYRNLGCEIPMIVAPSPANFSAQSPIRRKSVSGRIGFLGSLDWLPNQEGIIWFVNEVWGDLHRKHPDWLLNIAGRNTPEEWLTRWQGQQICVVGEVADAEEFVLSNDVMIVPILSGSGMRIKIIEAMALGKIVITTTIGAEGINGVHNRDFMLADTPAEFAACLERCFTDAALYDLLHQNAVSFIKQHFDAATIAEKVIKYYRKL
jgi:glycosyltransferase involved in cell wall biosynthesis